MKDRLVIWIGGLAALWFLTRKPARPDGSTFTDPGFRTNARSRVIIPGAPYAMDFDEGRANYDPQGNLLGYF